MIAECGRVLVTYAVAKDEDPEKLRVQAKAALQALVVEAPADDYKIGEHIERVRTKHDSRLVRLLLSEGDSRLLNDWSAELDAYRAWAGY